MSYQVLLRDDSDFYWRTEVATLGEAQAVASQKAQEVLRTLIKAPIAIGENTADFTQMLLMGRHQTLHLLIESDEHRAEMDAFEDIVARYDGL